MNFNKIILAGNLTRDPQLSYLPNQTPVVDFGLANNRKWKGKDGNDKEETCFVDCKAFGKTAENINKWFEKGRAILIEGRLQWHQWDQQDGVKRSKLEVVVQSFDFVPDGKQDDGDYRPTQRQNAAAAAEGTEDDMPF